MLPATLPGSLQQKLIESEEKWRGRKQGRFLRVQRYNFKTVEKDVNGWNGQKLVYDAKMWLPTIHIQENEAIEIQQ